MCDIMSYFKQYIWLLPYIDQDPNVNWWIPYSMEWHVEGYQSATSGIFKGNRLMSKFYEKTISCPWILAYTERFI